MFHIQIQTYCLLFFSLFISTVQAQSTSLNTLNQAFHQSLKQKLEHQSITPVFVYRHQRIDLIRKGQPTLERSIQPPQLYQELKSYAHLILLAHLELQDFKATKELDTKLNQYVIALKQAILDAKTLNFDQQPQGLPLSLLSTDQRFQKEKVIERQEKIATATLNLFQEIIDHFNTITMTEVQQRLKNYVYEIDVAVDLNIKHCAYLHLTVIHQQAKELYLLLNDEEKKTVQAIGYGSKGPRDQSLGLQYMAWLLGLKGEGERVIYFEGRFEDQDIFKALAKFNLELDLSRSLDKDPLYLQRDILGEDASSILRKLERDF